MNNVDIGAIVDRVKNILTNPKKTLETVRSESPSTKDVIIYLAIIAIPTLIGIILGYGVVGVGGFGYRFRCPFGWAVAWGVMQYVFSIVGVVILAYIITALAPSFSSNKDQAQALKLVAYGATPWLIAGILFIYPPLAFLVFLASIYGWYIMYLGLPVLMGTPEDKRIMYLVVTVVVHIIIMAIVSQVTGAIVRGSVGYHYLW